MSRLTRPASSQLYCSLFKIYSNHSFSPPSLFSARQTPHFSIIELITLLRTYEKLGLIEQIQSKLLSAKTKPFSQNNFSEELKINYTDENTLLLKSMTDIPDDFKHKKQNKSQKIMRAGSGEINDI